MIDRGKDELFKYRRGKIDKLDGDELVSRIMTECGRSIYVF